MKLMHVCFRGKSIKHVRLPLKLYRTTPRKDERSGFPFPSVTLNIVLPEPGAFHVKNTSW